MEQWRAELYHHGVKGMKWGVRRYQNYDGSYTQAGLKRYGQAVDRLNKVKSTRESLKADYKAKKASGASKDELKAAKQKYRETGGELRKAKKAERESYKDLAFDYMADEGKKLYSQGQTITSNTIKADIARIAAVSLAGAAAKKAAKKGIQITTKKGVMQMAIDPTMVELGGSLVSSIIAGKAMSDNAKLRAYYGHGKGRRAVRDMNYQMFYGGRYSY